MKVSLRICVSILFLINLSSNIAFANKPTRPDIPTILIVGGNHGIGFSLVKEYLKSGYQTYTTYNNLDKSQELLQIKNPKLKLLKVNLLDNDSIDKITKFIQTNSLDIIIYNAGMFGSKSNRSPNLDTQDWQNSFTINSIRAIQVAFALQDNLTSGIQKKYIAISSRRGSNAYNINDNYQGRYSYRSSKAALNSAMVALSLDWRPYKITTLMLHPGRVATQMNNFDVNGIDPDLSAKKIKEVIDNATFSQTGQFINVITKKILPW